MSWRETDLAITWQALKDRQRTGQWAVGSIGRAGLVRFEAGMAYPERLEAIVVTLPSAVSRTSETLPSGAGFDVVPINRESDSDKEYSVALLRRVEGDLEMFAIMAVDMLRQVERISDCTADVLWKKFKQRIVQWQKFMSKSGSRPLSLERQTGLFGELITLETMIETGFGTVLSLSTWVGPRSADQDFHVADGAIEVKSSVSEPFIAKISSMEQLDCERSPLYLCAHRLINTNSGRTLQDVIGKLRSNFANAGVEKEFNALLLLAGYDDEHADLYARQLEIECSKCFQVDDDFPHLTHTELPAAIQKVRYSLRIDSLDCNWIELGDMLKLLGAYSDAA